MTMQMTSWLSTTPGTWDGIYEAVEVAYGDDQTTDWDFTALTDEIVDRITDRLPAYLAWQPQGGVFIVGAELDTDEISAVFDETYRAVFDELLEETNESSVGFTFDAEVESAYTDLIYAE